MVEIETDGIVHAASFTGKACFQFVEPNSALLTDNAIAAGVTPSSTACDVGGVVTCLPHLQRS